MGSYYLHSSINIFNYIGNTNLLFTVMKHYIPKEDLKYYMRTTKADIAFQKRLLKYIVWGLPQFTFWTIMLINFLFYVIRGS